MSCFFDKAKDIQFTVMEERKKKSENIHILVVGIRDICLVFLNSNSDFCNIIRVSGLSLREDEELRHRVGAAALLLIGAS